MSPFFYAIQIGTLATWLSVAGFGTVGIVIPAAVAFVEEVKTNDLYKDLEPILLIGDFTVNDLPPSRQMDTGTTGETDDVMVPFAEQETLPTPPEMPEIAEAAPLPEIPELPAPAPMPSVEPSPAPLKPLPKTSNPDGRSKVATSTTGGSPQGKKEAPGKSGSGGQNGTTGMSDAKRLAGGRMPSPSYPPYARRNNQTGTVMVEFVVDATGRVISAYAKSPSPWPLLNNEAVRAVQRWKFPPGGVMKLQRPIVFKLN